MRLCQPFGLLVALFCSACVVIVGVPRASAGPVSSDSLQQGSDGVGTLMAGYEAVYVASTPLRPLVNDVVAGDVSGDLLVNEADIQLISDHWLEMGPPPPTGDVNEDNIVNIFDVNFVSARWNSIPIPEPSSLVLLGLALPALWWIRHATRQIGRN